MDMNELHQIEPALQAAMEHRLNRAIGQIEAVKRMLADNDAHACKEVVSQIKAARSALRKVSELYIGERISACNALPEPERSENIKEALAALAVD